MHTDFPHFRRELKNLTQDYTLFLEDVNDGKIRMMGNVVISLE